MDVLANLVCDVWGIEEVCESIIFLICGFDEAQMNDTLFPTIMQHTPAGASTYQIIQYGQEVDTGKLFFVYILLKIIYAYMLIYNYNQGGFHHWDWRNDEENMEHYGTTYPQPYNPEVINVPLSLYWSQNDWLADPNVSLNIINI